MPTVPTYQRKVQEAPIPGVPAPRTPGLEAFGGGASLERTTNAIRDTAQTFGRIAQERQEMAMREKQRADELSVLDGELKLAARQAQREREVSGLKGDKSVTAFDSVKPMWDSDIIEIQDSLANPEQKAAFARKAMAREIQFNDFVQKHVSTELDNYDKNQTNAYLQNSQIEASRHADDPRWIKKSLDDQAQAIIGRGLRRGDSREVIDSEIQEAVQSTHIGAMDRLISEYKFDRADSYLEAVKPQLPGDKVTQIKNMIEAGKVKLEHAAKVNQVGLEKELYLRTLPGTQNPLTAHEIDQLFRNEMIDIPTHKMLVNLVTKVNDDPRIPATLKTQKQVEVAQRFMELMSLDEKGRETETIVDPKTLLPEGPTKGNRPDQVREFQNFVAENAPYLTEQQMNSYLKSTAIDLNDTEVAKVGFFKSLFNYVKNLNLVNPGVFMTPVLATMTPDQPLEKTIQVAQQMKEKAMVTSNPRRAQYAIGDVIKLPNGKNAKVVGYYPDGEPDVEIVK